jgi:hypothetical protein
MAFPLRCFDVGTSQRYTGTDPATSQAPTQAPLALLAYMNIQ